MAITMVARGFRSFVLRTYIVGRIGVRELHIDWWVKVVPASPRGHDYPKVCVRVLSKIVEMIHRISRASLPPSRPWDV